MRRVVALALTGCLAAAWACTPARVRYEERLEAAPPRFEHAVHGERLRELMGGLERLVRERLPRAMDAEAPVEQRRQEIAAVARAMASAAARIPAAAVSESPAEREAFRSLARALERRAAALGRAAEIPLEELRAQAASIQDTCTGCHERFRIPGVRDAG